MNSCKFVDGCSALSTGESYSYDANGNMITRVEGGVTYTQTFDAENRLISITGGGATTQFIYDGDGNLVKKIKPDGSRTLYPSTAPQKAAAPLTIVPEAKRSGRPGVGRIYEVDKNASGSVTGTKTYCPAAGATLA